jgi:tryptophan 2,3-dioxygenase
METKLVLDDKVNQILGQLNNKYQLDGQSFSCHLEGLLHAGYNSYWNYTQLDILLNIQKPRTVFPDEMIFIGYHQITELYFKLMLWEMEQILNTRGAYDQFLEKVQRLNRYVDNLLYSFDIMIDGLDKSQFLHFRTALSPASGFQSVQFRQIELASTDLSNLLSAKLRNGQLSTADLEDQYAGIYWKEGAIEVETGKKDMSLSTFEEQYDKQLLAEARQYASSNLLRKYQEVPDDEPIKELLRAELRRFDNSMNVNWRLSHFRVAVKHLKRDNQAVKGTGGTNWQKYLPAKNQRVIFFPELWEEDEKELWGNAYIEALMK